jgi:hypothetical protein
MSDIFINYAREERQAKIYGDAANALLRAHVEQIEQILRSEQAQWGQLIGEIKPAAPPQSTRDPQPPS